MVASGKGRETPRMRLFFRNRRRWLATNSKNEIERKDAAIANRWPDAGFEPESFPFPPPFNPADSLIQPKPTLKRLRPVNRRIECVPVRQQHTGILNRRASRTLSLGWPAAHACGSRVRTAAFPRIAFPVWVPYGDTLPKPCPVKNCRPHQHSTRATDPGMHHSVA